MPAFLSHSSIDKAFVRAVAEGLSGLEVELDEFTFEYTMNVQAIRQALRRSDLVVFLFPKHLSNLHLLPKNRDKLWRLWGEEL